MEPAITIVLLIIEFVAIVWLAWQMLEQAEKKEWLGAFFYLILIVVIFYV
jgi:hypothetical protein